MNNPVRLLLVDDSKADLELASIALRDENIEIEKAIRVDDALDALRREIFDIVVADYRMPGRNGLVFLDEVRTASPRSLRCLMSGTRPPAVDAAERSGLVQLFTEKPPRRESVLARFRAS